MQRLIVFSTLVVLLGCGRGESGLREALNRTTGVVELPAGVIEIKSELTIPEGAQDLEIRGTPAGTRIRAADNFQGRAIIRVKSARRISFRNIVFEGNRKKFETPVGLPPSDAAFAGFYSHNGLLAEDVDTLTVTDCRFENIVNFPVLVSKGKNVRLVALEIFDSGSKNEKGRNNTSGGILLEEGVSGFEVRHCVLRNIRGNGIWTHSRHNSPRNEDGWIVGNHFWNVARDAIQVGHATRVRVENNIGSRIGYPTDEVDVEGGGTPVAIDTAGNVDHSTYARNSFEEINGKCIDLDGFHHGEVLANTCINQGTAEEYPQGHYAIVFNNTNPDMQSENIVVRGNEIDGTKFGGIFVIGTGHKIVNNRLRNLNLARCNESAARFGCSHFPDEPDLLQTGIYLGQRAERPAVARDNVVEDNSISGYRMKTRCIALAPGVSRSENRIGVNLCTDSEPGN